MTSATAWSSGAIGLVIALLLAGGCASEPRAQLRVDVSDAASGAPIVGAKVQAETLARNHPLAVSSLLGQTGPVTSTGFTDEAGRATLEYVVGRPVRVAALARGYAIVTLTVEEPWLGPASAESETGPMGGRMRVRVRE